jgi:hypothetical protein
MTFYPGQKLSVRDMARLSQEIDRRTLVSNGRLHVAERAGKTVATIAPDVRRRWLMRVKKQKVAGVEYTTDQLPAIPSDISYKLIPADDEVPDGFDYAELYVPFFGRPVRNDEVKIYPARIGSLCELVLNEDQDYDDRRLLLHIWDEQIKFKPCP